jgi:1-deoxy-D-xylulose-5-phosphate reductoisomerase
LAFHQRRIALLGSTGSIGRAVLEVAAARPDAFEVVSLSAFRNADLLAEQARRFRVREIVLGDEARAPSGLPPGVSVGRGAAALERLASDPDVDLVVNALVGAAGLRPTAASVRAGKRIALANKESLVMAGELIVAGAKASGSEIIPVDSEHSSIFRCLRGTVRGEVEGITLTASGGPLRDLPIDRLPDASLALVLAHPTWSMGEKVTVDSATLVNKAMEVIEAHWLFGLPFERIDVVIHRESIVHSLVRLSDGSMLAHLGLPDMRIPIQYAMFFPDAPPLPFGECALPDAGVLSFEPLSHDRNPCFGLIVEAGKAGGTAAAIAATADEVAVRAFVSGQIRFGDIASVIEEVLRSVPSSAVVGFESVISAWEAASARSRDVVSDLRNRGAARPCAPRTLGGGA